MKAVCRRFRQDAVGVYYQSRGVNPFPVWGDVQNFPQTTNRLPSNHEPAAYYPQIVLKNDELCLHNARETLDSDPRGSSGLTRLLYLYVLGLPAAIVVFLVFVVRNIVG
jgi:hypothetical protein